MGQAGPALRQGFGDRVTVRRDRHAVVVDVEIQRHAELIAERWVMLLRAMLDFHLTTRSLAYMPAPPGRSPTPHVLA